MTPSNEPLLGIKGNLVYARMVKRYGQQVTIFLVGIALVQLALFVWFPYRETSGNCEPTSEKTDQSITQEPTANAKEVPKDIPVWEKTLDFSGFNNETGTDDGHYIVPNYVHFVKFQYATFTLVHMVCVLAAFKHQKPEKLFFHTDVEFHGKYWEVLLNTPGFKEVLVINKIALPTEVFGQPLNSEWAAFHGGDVARLTVMRQYGGIYVDNDSYLIRSLNDLRRYEFVAAWRPGKAMMNQVVLAHKDARLLKEWQDGYKDYRPEHWYYNAGRQPANVLEEKPYLAHSVQNLLGTYDIRGKIYGKKWPEWRSYYSVHLMVRWMTNFRGVRYPTPIEEEDVLKYDNAFRQMVLDVYDINKFKRRKR